MLFKKLMCSACAVLLASYVGAAAVTEDCALAVAGGFLRKSAVAARLLPERTVASAASRGNLWIVRLEPSGYIEVAGSTKCAPILSYSSQDFAEPEVGSPWAADKEATYNTAWLSLWAQSLTGMGYKPGGSGGTRQLAASAEEYWYEKGKGYTYWNDGYEALWAAVKADLDWGSPIQINTAAHQMVIDGYAVENNGTEEEVDWINLNLGYGNAVYRENLKTAVTEGTYSGVLASFQTGFRPQKIVQFEPVPKVSGSSLTLA